MRIAFDEIFSLFSDDQLWLTLAQGRIDRILAFYVKFPWNGSIDDSKHTQNFPSHDNFDTKCANIPINTTCVLDHCLAVYSQIASLLLSNDCKKTPFDLVALTFIKLEAMDGWCKRWTDHKIVSNNRNFYTDHPFAWTFDTGMTQPIFFETRKHP